MDEWFSTFLLVAVEPPAQLSKVLQLLLRDRALLRGTPLHANKLLNPWISEPGVEMREREMLASTIISVPHIVILRLLKHLPGAIQPGHCRMGITNATCDRLQRLMQIVVNPRNVLGLAV